MKQIIDRIKEVKKLEWKALRAFQPDDLKTMTAESFEKLKTNIVKENFLTVLYVWQDADGYWLLDGHHRKYALEALQADGYAIPEYLTCAVLDAATKEEANNILLSYSSNHAKFNAEGLLKFTHDNNFNVSDLASRIDISGIDFNHLMNDPWTSDIDLAEKHGEHTDGIDGKVTIRCEQENVDRIKEEVMEFLKERGFSDASISG